MFDNSERGKGPGVFQLARAHRTQDAVAAVERMIEVPVARIERSGVGASHAVYLIDLDDGQRCVARFATHPEHHLAREVWASERCRRAGLPVPRVLAADFQPSDHSPPVAVYEYLPGTAGDRVSLAADDRRALLMQMAGIAAEIHGITVPGTGALARRGDGYGGTSASWAKYVQELLERRIGQLSTRTLPDEMARAIRQRFDTLRPALDAAVPPGVPRSTLVHGDFRLQNALLLRGPAERSVVRAVLDFEMVIAGDGVVDLAWLDYQDGRGDADLDAILESYGIAASDLVTRQRLRLYQLGYALEHLWWLEGFADQSGVAQVHARIRALLAE